MPQLVTNMIFAGAFGFLFALAGILKKNRISAKTVQVPHKFLQHDRVSYAALLKLQKEIGDTANFLDIVNCFDAIIEKIITESENIQHKKLQQNILLKLKSGNIQENTIEEITKVLQSLIKHIDKFA